LTVITRDNRVSSGHPCDLAQLLQVYAFALKRQQGHGPRHGPRDRAGPRAKSRFKFDFRLPGHCGL